MQLTLKAVFIFVLSLLFFNTADAQKDTTVYYLKSSGQFVSTSDSADFFLLVLPPDTNADKHLFVLNEYYKNGKIRMIGYCKRKTMDLTLQGSQISFFPNGHRMSICNYDNGELVGDAMEYYPNGKLYNIKTYKKEGSIFLKQCNDSTGIVLAENGNGKWIKFFNESFNKANIEGQIKNGLEEGSWHGWLTDSLSCVYIYEKGKIVSSNSDQPRHETFTSVNVVPEFPGGIEGFFDFVNHNLKYPSLARRNGIQGRVIVNFVVEGDGTLSSIKVAKGIGDGCDEEAIRIIKLSPPWKPGSQNGKPVRVLYTVPIGFSLDK
jgi:TonB family protein